MRTLLTALTALMLFATPVVAGEYEEHRDATIEDPFKSSIKEKSFRLYQLLADDNFVDAQVLLGLMYYRGDGIPYDRKKAVYWFRKAAEQGDAWAQYLLGVTYGKEEHSIAIEWFRKAAEQGHSWASSRLARGYCGLSCIYGEHLGFGSLQDRVQSFVWSKIAIAQDLQRFAYRYDQWVSWWISEYGEPPLFDKNHGLDWDMNMVANGTRKRVRIYENRLSKHAKNMTAEELAEGNRIASAWINKMDAEQIAKAKKVLLTDWKITTGRFENK